MGVLVALLIIAAIVLAYSLLGPKIDVERYSPTAAATTTSNVKKGLHMPSWGWNPRADANYAKKQEQQCTAGGGKIAKYSDSFYVCNGPRW